MFVLRENNIKIHYNTYGNKSNEAIVFLSGAGSDSYIWENQVRELQKKYFIITVDHRGSSKSDIPQGNYTALLLAEDLNAILEKEELNEINLVGFSMGGLVAQKFTNLYLNKVKKLILMNCSFGSGNPDTVFPEQEVVNTFIFVAALTKEDVGKNALDYNFGKNFEKENPEEYKIHFNKLLENYEGLKYQVAIMVSNDILIDDYKKLKMPIMAIFSLDDVVIPIENGKAFEKYIPHCKIEYLKGHHNSMLIHPEKVNQLIKNFIYKS